MSIYYTMDQSPIQGRVDELPPITLKAVDQSMLEPVWNKLMHTHHYLGFGKMVGARIKYIAFSEQSIVACIGFRAASLKLASRDDFIGWSPEQRKKYLPHLANNSRFLILPWVEVKNLGSHLLSLCVEQLRVDWEQKYGKKLLVVETFVDPQKFRATIYKAANWLHMGQTQGYTKENSKYVYHGNPKEVYLYPVFSAFRKFIGCTKGRTPKPKPSPSPKCPQPYDQGEYLMQIQENDWHPGLLKEANLDPEHVNTLAEKLVEFHEYFDPCFNRPAQAKYGLIYIKGLTSNLERKSVEPIALRYLGTDGVRNLQRFVSDYAWDEEQMLELYQMRLSKLIAKPESMVTVDSSENIKKGTESVGVARQYCGRLGKVENCQSGVFLGYTSNTGYSLVDQQLYLPEKWFNDKYAERRKKCRVPNDLTFKTKPEIAQELIVKAKNSSLFPARWLGCDAAFGRDHDFLDTIDEHYFYLAAVPDNTQVWRERPEIAVPPYKGIGRKPEKKTALTPSCSVRDVAKDDDIQWRTATLAEGSKGPINSEVAMLRVIASRDNLPAHECWLIMRKLDNGEIKYYLSNAPADLSFEAMIRVLTLRWPIEQSFKEGKNELGMDDYELRSWPGWHRHMVYVCLAMLFLLEVRMDFKKKRKNHPDSGSGQIAGECSYPNS